MKDLPLIIQQGKRRAIVTGRRVSLLKLRSNKKPEGVWPETQVADPIARMYAAHAWVMQGLIDFGNQDNTGDYRQ